MGETQTKLRDEPPVNTTGSIITKDLSQGIPCPYCPCVFCTDHDYHIHLEAFGYNPAEHLRKFRRLASEVDLY